MGSDRNLKQQPLGTRPVLDQNWSLGNHHLICWNGKKYNHVLNKLRFATCESMEEMFQWNCFFDSNVKFPFVDTPLMYLQWRWLVPSTKCCKFWHHFAESKKSKCSRHPLTCLSAFFYTRWNRPWFTGIPLLVCLFVRLEQWYGSLSRISPPPFQITKTYVLARQYFDSKA